MPRPLRYEAAMVRFTIRLRRRLPQDKSDGAWGWREERKRPKIDPLSTRQRAARLA